MSHVRLTCPTRDVEGLNTKKVKKLAQKGRKTNLVATIRLREVLDRNLKNIKIKIEPKAGTVYNYNVPGEPGARSLEPGQVETVGGQQDQGVNNTVGPGVRLSTGPTKPQVHRSPSRRRQRQLVSAASSPASPSE